ncbi:60S ribosomal protein L22 [Drosophila sechellia]|uniref:Large ribosomal subunit protein eL22 n=1 Tax=Drosophila sechellia TaxID=7238 RepID=B4I8I4_DROSE|nr:60S ribosomal protein L22 [Drosophila sechellia]EDW56909.1 GM15570 [Drosophila sechellia]
MKSQTQKKNAPKANSKAGPQPSKKAPAKVAPVETATPSAAPPLSSKKVAKAPAVALKNLDLAMKESAKKAAEAADQKLGSQAKKAPNASRKNLKQASEPVAPEVVYKKRSAPPTRVDAGKPEGVPAKKAALVQEKPKEQAPAAPKAEKTEVPASKAKSVAKKVATPATTKPKPKRAKNVLRGKRLGKKKAWKRFVIDCAIVAEDMILDLADFEQYLKTHIKIKNKLNQLKDQVTFERSKNFSLIIHSGVHFSKRYFKYLTKRYLKKVSLRDWLRVVSTAKDTFSMAYFKIQGKDDDDDDDDVADDVVRKTFA